MNERDMLDSALREAKAEAADLGARLATDQLILIVAVKVGDRLQLDPTWADVSSGRTVPRPSIEIGAGLAARIRRAHPHHKKI